MRTIYLLGIAVAAGACGHGHRAEAPYAVGGHLGGGSMVMGPDKSGCTYDAPPAVAEISPDKTFASLTGPGTVTRTCGKDKTTLEVVKPTRTAITGPDVVKVGTPQQEPFRASVYAGDVELRGTEGFEPRWTLGSDCAGVADLGPVSGAQDTGRDPTRTLVGAKAGSCTIEATLVGVTGQRTIKIE